MPRVHASLCAAAWAALGGAAPASAEGLNLELRGSIFGFREGMVQAVELDAGVHGSNGAIVVTLPLLFVPGGLTPRQEGAVGNGLGAHPTTLADAIVSSPRAGLGGARAQVLYIIAADVIPWLLANAFVGSLAVTVPSGALGGPASGGLDLSAALRLTSGFLRARDYVALEGFWLAAGSAEQQPAVQLSVGSGLGMGKQAWLSAAGAARWLPLEPQRWRAQLEVGAGYWVSSEIAVVLTGIVAAGDAAPWAARLGVATEL